MQAGAYSVAISGFAVADYVFRETIQNAVVRANETAVVSFHGTEASTATLSVAVSMGTAPAPGINVAIAGPAARSSVTTADGKAVFTSLPRGTYSVSVSGFDAAEWEFPLGTTKTVEIRSIGGSGAIAFAGERVMPSLIVGRVFVDQNLTGGFEAGDDEPFSGLSVMLSGDAEKVAATDALGWYSFRTLASGRYSVSISNPDPDEYVFPFGASASVDLAASQTDTADFRAYRLDTTCTDETSMVAATVSVGQDVVFDWTPACLVVMLLIDEDASDQWGIDSIDTGENRIAPPITYGVLPAGVAGIEEFMAPIPLVAGRTYRLILVRLLPAGSTAPCLLRSGEACVIALQEFTR